MSYILMRFATLATEGSPPTKSLTTRRRELMPPAIQSGHIDKKPQNPQAVFIALPGLCLAQPLNLTRRREEDQPLDPIL